MLDFASVWEILTNREALVALVRASGAWAPLLFMCVQVLQVVVWVIPGELTGIVGGYLFGTWAGFWYSMIGLTVGSLATFGIGHAIGPPLLRRLMGAGRYGRLRALTTRPGAPVAFVLYLIPGFPKDVLGYVFGASDLSVVAFFVVTTVARMPGTWVLSLQGAKAGEAAWGEFALIAAAAAVLAWLGYRCRDRLLALVRRRRDAEV